MYSEILPSLQDFMRFKGVERTHSTDSDGKWIILTTKVSKDAANMFLYQLIENSNTPNQNPNTPPGRSTKYNVKSALVSYAAMLQQNTEAIDLTKKNISTEYRNEIFKSPTI